MDGYQLHYTGQLIIRLRDGAQIPLVMDNGDYVAYLDWRANGGVPIPADPAPLPHPQEALDRTDRDAFLDQVDAAITAITANGWGGLSAPVQKSIMLGILRALKVAARRLA